MYHQILRTTIKTIVKKSLRRIDVSRLVLTFTSDTIFHELHAVWTNTLVASFSIHTFTICTRIILAFVGVWETNKQFSTTLDSFKTNDISKKRPFLSSNDIP